MFARQSLFPHHLSTDWKETAQGFETNTNLFPHTNGLCDLGQGLNLSEPQFPFLKNGHNDIYFTRLVWGASEAMQVRQSELPQGDLTSGPKIIACTQ